MYINPNTTIILLGGVPLSNNYNDTIYFATSSAQESYFISKKIHQVDYNSFQRVNKNKLRVSGCAANLYKANYMMFKNANHSSKWYYAFITSLEYVSENCIEIEYEIDVVQTWFFDYNRCECFVVREHSVTDNIGDNITPENLELGDYIINLKYHFDMSDMRVCILTSKDSDGNYATGKTVNGIYTPLNIIAGVPTNDPSAINDLIESFVGAGGEDLIINIYQYPAFCGDASTTTPQKQTMDVSRATNLDGYTPKNNKLFTYPYNMCLVSNNNGATAEYRWENWDSGHPSFNIYGVFMSTPCVICVPVNYRGISEDFDSGLSLSNFPNCPWVGDTYKAYMAQNKGAITSSMLSTVFSGLGNTMSGNLPGVVSTGVNALGNVINYVGKVQDLKATPPQVHGQVQCESLNAGLGRVKMSFYSVSIKKEYAQIIDDFFTKFGYATNRVKKPSINGRRCWNYVQTIGYTAKGDIPSTAAAKLSEIHDRGITYWMHGNYVGNYSLDNSV